MIDKDYNVADILESVFAHRMKNLEIIDLLDYHKNYVPKRVQSHREYEYKWEYDVYVKFEPALPIWKRFLKSQKVGTWEEDLPF